MKVAGDTIDDKIIAQIQRTIDTNPGLSRVALSRRVCEELRWRSRNGKLKDVSCRVALLKLNRRGAIRLPEAIEFPAGRRKRRERAIAQSAIEVHAALKRIQPVELVPVQSADSKASRVWNDLMDRYHDLGAGPLVGAQLRYLIHSSEYGWLGGLSFSAAAWSLQARDQWIGWSAEARQENLNQVVANSRFLILPHVHIPHLASHVLGQVLCRLRRDWKQRYGYEPLLVETFVDRQRFKGTCYRASNWIEVGQTRGRGRQDQTHRDLSSIKRVLLYPLDGEARQRLCQESKLKRRPELVQPEAQDWAAIEFGKAQLGDRRLNRRLLVLARDIYARPQAQNPQACYSRAKTKAAYRFLKHPYTQMDVLIEPHRQASQQRIAEHQTVLAVQDTTSLNYSTHPATQDLGPIGSRKDGIIGLIVHDTMAFSLEGTPLGLLDVQCWSRDAEEFGKKHQRKQRAIEEKESHKWLESFRRVAEVQRQCPNTMLVSVGDREADIYELFHLAVEDAEGPKLLVRAEQDRLLEDGQEHLWSTMAMQPIAGIQEVHVPRRTRFPARNARLEVRFAEVTLKPPKGKSRFGIIKLWAVLAEEVEAPNGSEPLCWMLLTTCTVTSFVEATQKLDWYTKRWCIEIYHKTLKSGCKIEERQLGDADSIEACLAIDMVVAWRIYHLTKLGRETPDVPCTVFFEDAEWKALVAFITQNPYPPPQPPTLRQATHMVASLGGYLGRKGDGEPGTKSLWLGSQRLDDITATSKLYVPFLRSPPVSSASSCG